MWERASSPVRPVRSTAWFCVSEPPAFSYSPFAHFLVTTQPAKRTTEHSPNESGPGEAQIGVHIRSFQFVRSTRRLMSCRRYNLRP
jgi:hypothetical protein